MRLAPLFVSSVLVSAVWSGRVAVAEAPSTAASPYDAELVQRQHRYAQAKGSLASIPALLGIVELWDEVEDRTPLVKFIDQIANDSAAHAEVRSRARFLRTLLADLQGEHDRANRERAALGILDSFLLIGPFDNEAKLGHGIAYPPETERAPTETAVAGKREPVAWRALPPTVVQGMINLDAVLRPATYATAYLQTALVAKRATEGWLRLGHQGAIKIWLNGALVFDRDRYHAARLDQRAVPIKLAAGSNRLLIKLSAGERAGALVVRLTDTAGNRLPEVDAAADVSSLRAAPQQKSKAKPSDGVTAVESYFAAAAKSGKPDALIAYASVLHQLALDEPERHRADSLLEQALAKTQSAQAYYTQYEISAENGDRRRALATAIQRGDKEPVLVRARWHTELGDLLDQLGLDREAEVQWRAALALQPKLARPTLRLAAAAADQSLVGTARVEVAQLGSNAITMRLEQARLMVRAGHVDDAERIFKQILVDAPGDLESRRELFGLARRRGDFATATKYLHELRARRPDLAFVSSELVTLALAQHQFDAALQEIDAALARAPGDAALEEQAGRLLERLGDRKQALVRLQHALQLVPQNPELRGLIAALDGSRAQALELQKKYVLSLDAIRELAQRPAGDDTARVLVDREVVHVLPQGLTEQYHLRAVQVLDRRSLRERSVVDVRYAPSSQRFELLSAKVLRKDGAIVEASTVEEHDVSEPWYGLYYDMSGVRVRFDALQPGDTVLVEYTLGDIAARNELGDYFGDLHAFQEDIPRLRSDYVILLPAERTLQIHQSDRAWLQRTEATDQGERTYWWTALDVPKIYSEPSMPGWSELSGYVHVSTFKSWKAVALFYETLLRGQQEPTQAIREATMAAIAGKKTPREKVTALYNLVVDKTRYVGLEFGIHGYQPYRVSQIFARKFGDCKDKASLLATMLRLAGIETEMVLARTRRGGDLRDPIASLAIFDHAIVYVPSLDLYLDGTAEFSGSLELPEQDQDIVVLRVGKQALVRTPVLPAATSHAETRWRVKLLANGGALVEEQLTLRGQATPEWRQHYQVVGEQRDKYERTWTDRSPGAAIVDLKMAVADREKPVTIDAQIEVPRWARKEGDALVQRLLGREPDMLRSYARLSSRRSDLIVGYPWTQTERLVVELPRGYKLAELPKPVDLKSRFGRFTTELKASGNTVEIEAKLEINTYRIATADYEAFRAFCQQIDAEVGRELRFVP